MKTFATSTLGCKVNQYETQQTRELLEQLDLQHIDICAQPDLVVVNTCCVTRTASAKSRRAIRKARKLSPHATIIATGCLPSAAADELAGLADDVLLISHNSDLAKTLAEVVNAGLATQPAAASTAQSSTLIKTEQRYKINDKSKLTQQPKLGPITEFSGQTRAFLKVQDGCDGYCCYCIIPKIRTKVCSKPPEIVIEEVKRLVGSGHKEIVLTGVFLGAYGQDTVMRSRWKPGPSRLAELVDKIAQVPGLERLRLSSLEPGDVTDELLAIFRKHKNLAPHLHLPLQSGSGSILRRMGRGYTVADFTQAVAALRDTLDRPAITTDVIVGFPGETDDNFKETLNLAKQIRFAKMHVFSFSPRAGTAAAKMQPVVPTKVIKERSRVLRNLDKQLQDEFRRQFIGEEMGMIVEDAEHPKGRCERYFMVHLRAPDGVVNGHLVFGTLGKNSVTADVIRI